nr:receptor-type tyrosine-protein phosphatase eta-like [Salvelinus alpinus]
MFGIMSRMSCFGVLLRTSVVLYLFLKGSQAQCAPCTNFKASTTATEINIQVHSNCNVSTGSTSVFTNSTMATLSGLAPGSTHLVHVLCNDNKQFNCCDNFTTKPETITILTVTKITTSSVSLSWTKPEGSSFYRVKWTDGSINDSQNTTGTSVNITGLTAGVQYDFAVTAVAEDNKSEGRNKTVLKYTKPAVIATPTVIQTTTSLSLSWTKPTGEAASYRVEFHNSGTGKDQLTSTTSAIIQNLTQGTQYTLQVIAIAQDKITEGDPRTSPELSATSV